MIPKRRSHALSLVLALLLGASPALARAEAPARLASGGRFDLTSDVPIGNGRVISGDGSIDRMNWVPAARVDLGYTITFRVGRLAWKSVSVEFTPTKAGTVTLALMGPWEQAPGGGTYRQEILWDDLKVEGAVTAAHRGFESKDGWEGSGLIETSPSSVPPASGSRSGRTWHDQPLSTRLTVKAGVPVVIQIQALARTPEGFQDMKRIVGRDTPAHRNTRKFLRGANLGNGLEVPPGQNWAVKYTDHDIEKIKAEGFDHIRIPVGWHHYAGLGPEFKLSDEIFRRVDSFVDAAGRVGLAALVNVHHFDDFTSDPTGQTPKFLAIWHQVSAHYARRPGVIAYELLNEPKDAATTEVVNPIFAEAVKVIRKNDPDRLIVIGPGRWNSISELVALRLPDDPNILVTVHSYDPFFFTHQGAPWARQGDDAKVTGIRFPGPPPSPLTIDSSLKLDPGFRSWIQQYNTEPAGSNPSGPEVMDRATDQAREWSEYYGRPIYLGEFGAIMRADPASRANFYREYRHRLEKAGIGWAIWDWHAGFDYWDVEHDRPRPGMHEALFGQP